MVTDMVAKHQIDSFANRLRHRAYEARSWLCVGLDPDRNRLPAGLAPDADGVSSFCRTIIEATAATASAFKINFAFFEALGPSGWEALARVRATIPAAIPV